MLRALRAVGGEVEELPWQTLVRYMEATGLDVLFLQEIKGEAKEWEVKGALPLLAAKVNKHSQYNLRLARGYEGGKSGVGVLVNTTTVSFDSYTGLTKRLKDQNAAFDGRVVAIETNNLGSAPLVLIGVYNFTGSHGTFKIDLLKALLSECTRIRAEGKFPVLVGDFNTNAKRILREQENMPSPGPRMRDANLQLAQTPRRSNFSSYRDTLGYDQSSNMAQKKADDKPLSVLNRESVDGGGTGLVDFILVHADVAVLEPTGRMVGCSEAEGCTLFCEKRECAERAIVGTIGKPGHLLPPDAPFFFYHAECVSDHLLVHASIQPPALIPSATGATGKRAAAEGLDSDDKKAKKA